MCGEHSDRLLSGSLRLQYTGLAVEVKASNGTVVGKADLSLNRTLCGLISESSFRADYLSHLVRDADEEELRWAWKQSGTLPRGAAALRLRATIFGAVPGDMRSAARMLGCSESVSYRWSSIVRQWGAGLERVPPGVMDLGISASVLAICARWGRGPKMALGIWQDETVRLGRPMAATELRRLLIPKSKLRRVPKPEDFWRGVAFGAERAGRVYPISQHHWHIYRWLLNHINHVGMDGHALVDYDENAMASEVGCKIRGKWRKSLRRLVDEGLVAFPGEGWPRKTIILLNPDSPKGYTAEEIDAILAGQDNEHEGTD